MHGHHCAYRQRTSERARASERSEHASQAVRTENPCCLAHTRSPTRCAAAVMPPFLSSAQPAPLYHPRALQLHGVAADRTLAFPSSVPPLPSPILPWNQSLKPRSSSQAAQTAPAAGPRQLPDGLPVTSPSEQALSAPSDPTRTSLTLCALLTGSIPALVPQQKQRRPQSQSTIQQQLSPGTRTAGERGPKPADGRDVPFAPSRLLSACSTEGSSLEGRRSTRGRPKSLHRSQLYGEARNRATRFHQSNSMGAAALQKLRRTLKRTITRRLILHA